ncbi:MAG: hypothetical protein Q7S99_15865 [Parvibaculum sp.]|nr:hypothetical protein [Parvibaculum sp.]
MRQHLYSRCVTHRTGVAFLLAASLGLPMGRQALADDLSAIAVTDEASGQWAASFSSQVQYYSWESTSGYPAAPASTDGSGSQVYVPIALQLSHQAADVFNIELQIRSGYVYSRQSNNGVSSSTKGTTDTSLSTSLSYTGFSSFQPFLSLSTNLPTGDSSSSSAANTSSDSDIVAADTYGEGFNGGASVGANIPLTENLLASLGIGYTYRGSYDRATLGNLDPGDTYSVNIGIGYEGDSLTTQAQLSYTGETETTVNGAPYYQSGGTIVSTLALSYAWDDAIASRLNASFSHIEKNRILPVGTTSLVSEAFNSNSNVIQLDSNVTYSGENYIIGPTLGFLYRDHNAWSPTDLQFLSAKTKWSVGVTGQYALNPALSLSLDVARIWMKQDQTPDKTLLGPGSAIPEIDTDAWQATIGTSWQF